MHVHTSVAKSIVPELATKTSCTPRQIGVQMTPTLKQCAAAHEQQSRLCHCASVHGRSDYIAIMVYFPYLVT